MELIVICVGTPVYRDIDWAAVRDTMQRPLIIDGRRLLPVDRLRELGYIVSRVGDGVSAGNGRA
jgi:hypothetical protein